MSGIISDDISKALAAAADDDKREYRQSGDYLAEVSSVAIAEKPKPWIDKALVVDVKFPDEIGGEHKIIIELAPCLNKEKTGISPGKIKFLRWQLGALGLDVDELAFQLYGIIGNTYKVRYTVDSGVDAEKFPNEPGNINPKRKDRNPHTNLPYINNDCIFLEKVEAEVPVEDIPDLDLTAESEVEA